MNPIEQLEQNFSREYLDDTQSQEKALTNIIDRMQGFVKLAHCLAVLSDLASRKSYIFHGQFATYLGMGDTGAVQVIDSIWEEEIYDRIHPSDLFERNILELEFFNFLKQKPVKERLDWKSQSVIRMLGESGKYRDVIHQCFYIGSSSKGGLWLEVCTYNHSTEKRRFQDDIAGKIINMKTGEIFIIKEYTNSKDLLSSRELVILSRISEGLMSKEIAEDLKISIHTVNRHRQNILQKLRANNAMEAVKIALAMNLL